MVLEINGNLDSDSGIPNYEWFSRTTLEVYSEFLKLFGAETMNKLPLYIDNVYSNEFSKSFSGHTPSITPVHKSILVLKLNVEDGIHRARIILQLSHELTHYVFFSMLGIDKVEADDTEEKYCTAMSLIFLKEMCSDEDLESHKKILSEYNNGYGLGVGFAEKISYNKELLRLNLLNLVEQRK